MGAPSPDIMDITKIEAPRVAILQSCYIPWRGYFDIIGSVDVFVILDDVQYSKNHWHNRNLIKTTTGSSWLTIPVSKAEGAFQPIDRVTIAQAFAEKHWRSIKQAYARAPYMKTVGPVLEDLYGRVGEMKLLTDINMLFLEALSNYLGLATRFVRSSELDARGGQTERLVNICQELGADRYLSGPSAATYIRRDEFDAAGIALEWMDYSGYPAYGQLHGGFIPAVSIIDLLLNTGPDARRYMKAKVHA